ncbi:MAG TPA: excinuclease ABC subunit UvrA [Acidobacteriaceae bacterium]|nr:excinuclease ABC subunit UvrA [Acidobacteriaceae bacterium]
MDRITVRGARVHNLKNIDFEIPHGVMTVVTGVSGSGKSSLAFDTIYAEGQRRYVESLSAYARQFLERMEKPDVDHIDGLAPAIAIKQKNTTRNPRSTVATATEIYDYLRLLYARCGTMHCLSCGGIVKRDSVDEIATAILGIAEGTRLLALFPVLLPESGEENKSAAAKKKALKKAAMKKGASRPTKKDGKPITKAESAAVAASKIAAKVNRSAGDYVPDEVSAEAAPLDPRTKRLGELRQRGFNRLYQGGKTVEFATPESLLELDFSQPVYVLVDRIVASLDARTRIVDAAEAGYRESGEIVFVTVPRAAEDGTPAVEPQQFRFSGAYACTQCNRSYREPEPPLFSFNNPFGACPRCEGFGNTIDFDLDRIVPDKTRTLMDGAIDPWVRPKYRSMFGELRRVAKEKDIPLNVAWNDLSPAQRTFILYGEGSYPGVHGFFSTLEQKKYKLHVRVFLSKYRGYALCPECKGKRLRAEARAVKIEGRDICDATALTVGEAQAFFSSLALSPAQMEVAGRILEEVRQRLRFLKEVGLDYLSLDRLSSTLSGGEAQRVQLATSLGSQLVGAMYVLDEPSIGLHPRDTGRLIRILEGLRDLGNTMLVVEHDPDIIRAADYLLDLGPGAGELGGKLLASGTLPELMASPGSLTGKYLKGQLSIPVPARRRTPGQEWLRLTGARAHNLKSVDCEIPLGMLTCITGVSGSGKSTLVHDVLYRAVAHALGESDIADPSDLYSTLEGAQFLNGVVLVDQSPIGRTPRSNPVTYLKALDGIRELFASLPDAKRRGYSPGFFSFNVPGGRCDVCQGDGTVTVEMQFLADVELPCEECNGMRFKAGVLEVKYKGKNVYDVLSMTVKEALQFFAGHVKILDRLRVLDDVGLGYVRLGQSATTLSGGEAQRVKLAAHLANARPAGNQSPKRAKNRLLYILDEPTTGLHFDDVSKLLSALRQLIDGGGSLLVIEHNLDVLKAADWVIDLGPEGGRAGGEIVAAGTPEQVAGISESHTGQWLARILPRVPESAILTALGV